MDAADLTFIGGLLLGFASSLHCAGMCGGIASGLLFAFDRHATPASRAQVLLSSQAGRILAYVLAGGFLGGVGSQFYGSFNHVAVHEVMRWAAAVALGWVGLSLIGLAPPLSILDRVTRPIVRLATGPSRLAYAGGLGGPFVAGVAWGFLPCGMVFGALFYAMLSGSGPGGALVMAGFGLGTVPAVVGTAFGISELRNLGQRPSVRLAAGLSLALVAVGSIFVPAAGWAAFCLP
ncbi:MAG: sulfite exporter TauE/SafE family protein [Rhizobiaceae bacterium]|nr:sulfite exporter TauE/SafE family protein [Rhizobiaceae bacterium]